VGSILQRALAKPVGDRYARAGHLEEDVEDVLAGRPPRHAVTVTPVAPSPAAAPTGGVGGWLDGLGWRALLVIAVGLALIAAGASVLRRPSATPVAAPPVVASPSPARLEVSFRHPFRAATVRVWVDGALTLEQSVPGRVTRDLLALKLRRGTFNSTFDVPPGERVVRVQVDDGGQFRESRRIRATFTSGRTRRLDATVEGMLQKDLALALGP
jgi:hypothetical protein